MQLKKKKKKGSPTNLSPSFFSGHHLNTHTPLIEGIRQGLLLAFSPQNFFVGACLPFVSLSRPTSLYHKFFFLLYFLSILVKMRWEAWWKKQVVSQR